MKKKMDCAHNTCAVKSLATSAYPLLSRYSPIEESIVDCVALCSVVSELVFPPSVTVLGEGLDFVFGHIDL
jgi:hypothetical protein